MIRSHLEIVTSSATALIGTVFVAAALVGIAAPARAEVPAGVQKAPETQVVEASRFAIGTAVHGQGAAMLRSKA